MNIINGYFKLIFGATFEILFRNYLECYFVLHATFDQESKFYFKIDKLSETPFVK